MKRKVQRNDFKYASLSLDEYSYDKSWIHSENRNFDLDIDDSDIDHLNHQQATLKQCLDEIDKESHSVLDAQILYE